MSTLYVEVNLTDNYCEPESLDINEILDRDLDILVPRERTIELWLRVFGQDPDYNESKKILLKGHPQKLNLVH